MNNRIVLSSLAMDLKRAALCYYKGSNKTAEVFCREALLRKNEVDLKKVQPYVINLLVEMEKAMQNPNKKDLAEDLLMYSTLFQNYTLHIL